MIQARETTRQEVPWRTFQFIKIDPTMAALEIKMKLTIPIFQILQCHSLELMEALEKTTNMTEEELLQVVPPT